MRQPTAAERVVSRPPRFGRFDFFDNESTGPWRGEISRISPDYVGWVQSSLNRILGLRLAVDGIAGSATRSAIRTFQRRNGLAADGVLGPMTEQALMRTGAGNPTSASGTLAPSTLPAPAAGSAVGYLKDLPELQTITLAPAAPVAKSSGWPGTRLTLVDIYNRLGGLMGAVARKTQVEVAAVLAVWKVESGPYAHVPGKAVIRFENHLFYRLWGTANESAYAQYFRHGGYRGQSGNSWENHKFREEPSQAFRDFHGKQEGEYQALRTAIRLAGEYSALQCISIGGPQILGSHYALIGYRSPREMYDAFQAGERAHVLGFFDYCQHNKQVRGGLLPFLRAGDFRSFARYYNGSGQVDFYSGKIQEAYDLARQLPLTAGETATNALAWGQEWETEVSRTSPDYVRWVQSSLNRILGLRLAIDGIAGSATRSAIRTFQSRNGLTTDGIVGPVTEAALVAAGAGPRPSGGGSYVPVAPRPAPAAPSAGTADIVSVRGIQVARQIASQLENLLAAAEAGGIRLGGSGYRSPQEQIGHRIQNCCKPGLCTSHYDIFEKSSKECDPWTARPGTSNHERGLAIDFNYNGNSVNPPKHPSTAPAFQWLQRNAARFGLYNLASEPWHWSIDGN